MALAVCLCRTYLVTISCVEQDPADLDGFGRIFGHIDTMFVAGSGYMDDDVALETGALWVGHGDRCRRNGK